MFSEVRRAVGLGYCGFHCNYPEDHDQSAHFTMCTDGGGDLTTVKPPNTATLGTAGGKRWSLENGENLENL